MNNATDVVKSYVLLL